MVKTEHLAELLALLSEYEKLDYFLNSGHYVIKIDARFGDYAKSREEHIEMWLTGEDDEVADLGLPFVFDLVKSRMKRIEQKLTSLGLQIENPDIEIPASETDRMS